MKTIKKLRKKLDLLLWFKKPKHPLRKEYKRYFQEEIVILSLKKNEALYMQIGRN